MSTSASPCQEIRTVQRWLTDVVIGLNLCPFAARPTSQKQVRFAISDARNEEALIQDLQQELLHISQRQPTELETSLLIIPHALADFFDYNQFLNWVDKLLETEGWEGTFQVASFHPHYQFGGTEPEDAENLTNRAYPILHIIREPV